MKKFTKAQKAMLADYDDKYHTFMGDHMNAFHLGLIGSVAHHLGETMESITCQWLCLSKRPISYLHEALAKYGFPIIDTQKALVAILEVVKFKGKYQGYLDAWKRQ